MVSRLGISSDIKKKFSSVIHPLNKENVFSSSASSSTPSSKKQMESYLLSIGLNQKKTNPNLKTTSKSNLSQILNETSHQSKLNGHGTSKYEQNGQNIPVNNQTDYKIGKQETENNFFSVLKERAIESSEKKNRIRKLSEQKEMQECYFSPKINRDQKQVEVRSLDLFLHDQAKYEDQKKLKKAHLIQELSHKQAKDLTLTPQINLQSNMRNSLIPIHERLYSLTRDTQKSQESYNFTGSTKILMTSEGSGSLNQSSRLFSPSINHKSQILQRNQTIDVLLYSDAKRRQDKQLSSEKEIPAQTISLNERSEQVYAGSFARLFESAWIAANKRGSTSEDSTVDYLEANKVLQQLLFISQNIDVQCDKGTNMNMAKERSLVYDLWVNLRGNLGCGVTKRNLFHFLLAIQGIKNYPSDSTSQKTLKESRDDCSVRKDVQQQQKQQSCSGQQQEFGYFIGENWFIGDSQKTIQKKYDLLIKTRLNQSKIRHLSPKNQREGSLSHTSPKKHVQIDLTKREQSPLVRFELLVQQNIMQKKRHTFLKEQKEQKKLEGCSFQPNLDRCAERIKSNPNIGMHRSVCLFTTNAKPSSQRRDKATFDLEYEKSCDECTFHPDISLTQNVVSSSLRRSNSSRHNTSQDQFFEKTVHRMRKARQDIHNTSVFLQRGYNNTPLYQIFTKTQENNGKHSEYSFDEKNSNSEKLGGNLKTMTTDGDQVPSSLWTEEDILQEGTSSRVVTFPSERRNPLLFVDVNINQNQSERIIIYDGDEASVLAKEFALIHNLDEQTSEKLKQMLLQQMANYIERLNNQNTLPQ